MRSSQVLENGFWLLVLGFFTCGFQVQYINNHLPAYLQDMNLDPIVGATAISVIGLFNMIGSWISGWLGDRYRKKYLVAMLYFGRSLIFMIFILAPISEWSVYLFADGVGLARDRSADLGHRIRNVRAAIHGDALRHRVPQPPDRQLRQRLAGRQNLGRDGIVRARVVVVGGALASLLHWPIDDRPEVLANRRAA